MPFDIWSDLALTALCGTALITWIGGDLAAVALSKRFFHRVRANHWARADAAHILRRSTPSGKETSPRLLPDGVSSK